MGRVPISHRFLVMDYSEGRLLGTCRTAFCIVQKWGEFRDLGRGVDIKSDRVDCWEPPGP